MNASRHTGPRRRLPAAFIALTGLMFAAIPASAQHGRPAPADANSRAADAQNDDPADHADRPAPDDAREADDRISPNGPNRRPSNGEKYALAFNDVDITETFTFIVETTGKVVIPVNLPFLQNQRITLANDEPLDRQAILDMLFTAFRLNDIGVIEQDDVIIIGQLADTVRYGKLPVIDGDTDIMARTDKGSVVIKIFPIRNVNAEGIGERIENTLPDYASLSVDANSNQIVLVGDIGLCQQVQKMINQLDRSYVEIVTRTFRLAYADAAEVADNIYDLFEDGGATPTVSPTGQRPRTTQQRGTQARQQQTGTSAIAHGPIVEPRITVNFAQNSLTLQAEKSVVRDVSRLIEEEWDLPRPKGTSRVYRLRYSDPVTMRDILREILEQDGFVPGRTGGQRGAAGRGGQAGERGDVSQIFRGIFRIEALSDTNSLVVIAKTEENFYFLDNLIEQLDQPSTAGLPMIIELKHADAVSLTEELNVLLQHGGGQLPRPRRDLTGGGLADRSGQQAGTGGGMGGAGQAARGNGAGQGGTIQFPWQERQPEFGRSPESPLIGRARIVPIVRQNALAVLAPEAQKEPLRDIIEQFDKPGRQVMISAVIAEVTLDDSVSLGLRMSSQENIIGPNPDFGFGGQAGINIVEDPLFGSLFTSSVLDANFNINIFLQALEREQKVRIIQQPQIFTSDNQEAVFFDGQTVPFISQTLSPDVGGLRQQFDREDVGVILNVRPRITVEGDVDMAVYLEVSSVAPGTAGEEIVIDRRETSTQIVVQDGQTIVISGILREQESEIRRRFPILGHIPVLDLLFSSRETQRTQSELIAFITPTIVERPADNDHNYNVRDRERLRQLSLPLDQHDQQDAIRVRERILDPGGEIQDHLEHDRPNDD